MAIKIMHLCTKTMILSLAAADYMNAIFQPSMKGPSCEIGEELRFFHIFFDNKKIFEGNSSFKNRSFRNIKSFVCTLYQAFFFSSFWTAQVAYPSRSESELCHPHFIAFTLEAMKLNTHFFLGKNTHTKCFEEASLSQWLNFKLLGITYLIGKMSSLDSDSYFMVRNG